MDFSNMNIWYWLIALLCILFGLIISYLLGKNKVSIYSKEFMHMQKKNIKLQEELNACKDKLSTKINDSTIASLSADEVTTNSFDAAAAKAAFGKNIKPNDLKIIEGIGPKIAFMFNEAGITTWKKLSESAVADCQKILDKGGNRYKIHDPSSWPMQGKMAYEGKWVQLAKWQEKHDRGKL